MMVTDEVEQEGRRGEETPSTKVAKARLLKGSMSSLFFPLCLGLENSLGDFSEGLGEFFFLFVLWRVEEVDLEFSESERSSFSSSDEDCPSAKEFVGQEDEIFRSTSKISTLFEFLVDGVFPFGIS